MTRGKHVQRNDFIKPRAQDSSRCQALDKKEAFYYIRFEEEIAMPRVPRAEVFDPDQVCILHLIQRCVRRSFLTGVDPVSGKDFSFRREWIRARMERLASVFAIDVLSYAILSNHIHIVARNRPDVVKTWSNEQIALRWLRIFPGCHTDEFLGDPTESQVSALAGNQERIDLIRRRLSDFSWFMKALCEPIARVANRQDKVTGHFWEGRFKAQAITDEAGLLACSIYVDLNPIRAAMATSPEQAVNTSAYDRIQASKGAKIDSSATELVAMPTQEAGRLRRTLTPESLRNRKTESKKRRGTSMACDAWLSPLPLNERVPVGPQASKFGVRASDKGFLSMSLSDYVTLLRWVAVNAMKTGKKVIPKDLQPVLRGMQLDGEILCDMVKNFKKYFGRGSAAGMSSSMKEHAASRNRHFIPGQRAIVN